MWKWIGGILLVLVVLISGTCYSLYRKVVKDGDAATIVVAGTPARIFASLSSVDSMMTWVNAGTMVTPTGHGDLAPGDSLTITSVVGMVADSTAPLQTRIWVVREVQAPERIVLDRIGYSGTGQPFVEQSWSTQLTAQGDSTVVTTRVSIPSELTAASRMGDTTGKLRVVDRLQLGVSRAEAQLWLGGLAQYFGTKP